MASDERLMHLGLLHLQHKPRELAAALDAIRRKFDKRREAVAKRKTPCRANGRRKAS